MTEEFIDKEFISEVSDMVTEKYESEMETISRCFAGHEKAQLLKQLNAWHERMTAGLQELKQLNAVHEQAMVMLQEKKGAVQ